MPADINAGNTELEGEFMGKPELSKFWEELRLELLNTGDMRKKILVEVMDVVMKSYRENLTSRGVNIPKNDGIQSCDDCSANAI
jgi:hypothetical protein